MRLRDIMPKSLFGRSLFIVGLPLVFLQVLLAYFFERHWEDVGRRLVLSVAGEIALITDEIINSDGNLEKENLTIKNAQKYFGANIIIIKNKLLSAEELNHPNLSRLDKALNKSLKERIDKPHTFNTTNNKNRVNIMVQLPKDVLSVNISKKDFIAQLHIYLLP